MVECFPLKFYEKVKLSDSTANLTTYNLFNLHKHFFGPRLFLLFFFALFFCSFFCTAPPLLRQDFVHFFCSFFCSAEQFHPQSGGAVQKKAKRCGWTLFLRPLLPLCFFFAPTLRVEADRLFFAFFAPFFLLCKKMSGPHHQDKVQVERCKK